ncbi:2-amino-4-hydroxy-6-hydroxymethyldihydropteridine diphosphokinase [Candidatus Neoehrlichia procyonis]|uniref:2-amino-4-hydroxy-6-hydroxymethyldihydropteridine pyrophosphokinase n=1 Tax=Candidatus Neoehrlichia procyonis str. RAC413 TaxID=1359163 RepID=A0A0F3NM40_9RICK|nr:2-amino-4-hydroxy-6-hydroxymethyldihydropteridine diphosphokinase [Candidatus Neoehrlichia lotoris]KJV69118.1 2-amino-4-hydroxy-6-hydroxymethyldihydropteridine diphosphokinase [Candidatus Neoehrlichia lotoris str. RAC413]
MKSYGIVVLSLGSNLGYRLSNIQLAIRMLPIVNKVCSCVYESEALLPHGAPISWNIPFLNMAVAGYTDLSPFALLCHIKKIENFLGRRNKEFWSPRTIDIDIILWNNVIINDETLQIPHQHMRYRDFVLIPICDICPQFTHNVFNISINTMLLDITQVNLVQRLNSTNFILHPFSPQVHITHPLNR